MRRPASGFVRACVALWLGACTADFGDFEFASDGPAPPERLSDGSIEGRDDAGSGAPMSGAGGGGEAGGAGAGGAGEGGAGAGGAGAGGSAASDSGSGGTAGGAADASVAGDGSGGAGGQLDAGNTGGDGGGPLQDASMSEDAEVPPTDQCAATWESAGLEEGACESCACAECSSTVDACLSAGSLADRARCAAVLECAIANDCKDWTCYCTNTRCGASARSGDGPCASEMDAAANGAREEVMEIRQEGDPGQPLVRAMNAIGCVLGLDSRSPRGPRTGECDSVCP